MRMKIGILAAFVGFMLALGASPSARAIVESIIDAGSAALVGSMTFPTFTGSADAGVLFSYGEFTQADITSISWTLDPTTDAVLALDLHAFHGDSCPSDGDCSNSTLNLSPVFATSFGVSCSGSGDLSKCFETFGEENIIFVPLTVPEPSTWAMMVVGLLGLGLMGRRSRQPAG